MWGFPSNQPVVFNEKISDKKCCSNSFVIDMDAVPQPSFCITKLSLTFPIFQILIWKAARNVMLDQKEKQ